MGDRDVEIRIKAAPQWLAPLRGFVRGYFESCGLLPERVGELVLAIDEAVTNSMRHSYGGDESKSVEVAFASTQDDITVVLRDKGLAADPDRVKAKAAAATLKSGGRGVQILYQVFDEVRYRRLEPMGNEVTMRLRIR